MSNTHRVTARLPRLADHLAAAHRQRFWGRGEELALFRSALRADAGASSLFYVHGRAAERLGLAFGTYRYHLAQGTARVVARLWERELYGRTAQISESQR